MSVEQHTVPEHTGLGRSERGNHTLMGALGHWHRYTENGQDRRRWVKGTVEACETDLSDADLLARIREADETFDPAPDFTGRKVEPYEISLVTEEPNPEVGVHPVDAVGTTVVKPERGGKRICEHTSMGRKCGHSESRHSATGRCRTCECTDFMIEV